MKRPSFQWYPGDWLSKPEVRACSIAARGLWIDMICLMHEGEPYGHLTIRGKVVLPNILARITGTTVEEVETLLAELEGLGVFSRTEDGIIYSRRMVQDERIRQTRAEGGFKSLDNPNVPKPKTTEGIPSVTTSKVDLEGIPPETTFDPSPSSSSSSSSSEEKEKRSHSRSERSRRPVVCDDEYLAELQANPAYQGLDVRRLYQKMVVWCEQKRKKPTRLRLINWLNHEEQPMTAARNTNSQAEKRRLVC